MNYIENFITNPSVKQVNTTTRIEENKTDNGKKVVFKGDKKKIVLALAGMAAVGIAGVLLYKKFHAPQILNDGKALQNEAEGIQEQAAEIIKESERIKEQASGIINEVEGIKEQADSVLSDAKKIVEDTISKIKEALKLAPEKIKEENGQKVFEEMQDGILRNKSFFTLENNNVILNSIERYKENGIKDVVKLENNCAMTVMNNVKESTDGTLEAAKRFFFKDGILSHFYEGYKELADGTREAVKRVFFKDGKLREFNGDYKELAGQTWEYAKGFGFKDGQLSFFREGYKELPDSVYVDAKGFFFEDGILSHFYEGYKELAGGLWKTDKICFFKDGKLINMF